MSVRFEVHAIARKSIAAWRERMQRRRGGRELMDTYFEALVAELTRSKGQPDGVEWLDDVLPELGVWEFMFNDTWVVFTRRLVSNWWTKISGRRQVELFLIGLFPDPLHQVQLASLARTLSTWGR